MLVLVAVFPLLLFVVLLLLGKLKVLWASVISLLATSVLTFYVWKIDLKLFLSSILKGGFISFDILLIVFGAILFIGLLKKINIIENLCYYLGTFSQDLRIQVILLAWFLENFLEGTAGFGTPSAVVAPILIGLGITPIWAVAIAMLGNSASVVFGAAGTPIRVGFSGLDISRVPYYSGLFNLVGILVPVFMLFAVTYKKENWKKYFWEGLPFSVFSGVAYSIPAFLITYLGQEFPAILGSIVGILFVILAIKFKFLLPKNIMKSNKQEFTGEKIPLKKVIFPYLLLVSLLILGKFLLEKVGYSFYFGLNHRFSLFNPGIIFLLTSFIVFLIWRKHLNATKILITNSIKKSIEPFLVVFSMSALAQIMINSGQTEVIAQNLKTNLLPVISPFLGAFGSFMTGSATVSNIMFGGLLAKAAVDLGMIPSIILSLGVVGAAAGNMIALADIMPALAVVNLKGKERSILKRVFVPCLIYIALVGIIGLAVV